MIFVKRARLLLVIAGLTAGREAEDFGMYDEVSGVLIFKNSRSGSTWFHSLLNSLSDVTFGGESFSTSGTCKTISLFGHELLEMYLRVLLARPGLQKLNAFTNFTAPQLQDYLINFTTLNHKTKSRHIVTGGFGTPCCTDVNLPAVLTQPLTNDLIKVHQSKTILYLRTNVIKIAVAVLHDDPKYKVCKDSNKRRQLGTGHNLQKNCEFRTPDISTMPFVEVINKIVAAIWANERIYRGSELLGHDYLTIYYEDLQRDTIGQLRRFKEFMGLDWTTQDELTISEGTSTYVKATSDNLVTVIGSRLVSELDTFFMRFRSLKSHIHDGDDIALLSKCLHDMLHSTEATTFGKPCTPYFSDRDKYHLRGLRTRTFCRAFVTQDEIDDGVSHCAPDYHDNFHWTNQDRIPPSHLRRRLA